MHRRFTLTLTLALAFAPALGGLTAGPVEAETAQPSTAVFEGRTLDLSRSWGEATACWVRPDGTVCYRSEAQMGAAQAATTTPDTIEATCSTTLKLFDGTSWTGQVLALGTRFTVINLATYGFANRTSSYAVGACSAQLRDGGGTLYPGNTAAGASSASMLSGWDNRVTTAYLN
jgi:hypothetical protein